MIWFGKLLLGLSLAGPVPEGLAERVRAALAREWGVTSPVVRLQWGVMPIRAPLTDQMPFRLAGRGQDGRYVLLVTTDRGELAVSLRAGVEDSTWVASRPLAADVRLGPDDVKREIRTVWGPTTK